MIIGKFPSLRLRRSRKETWSRRLIQENTLSPNDFILPIFLIEGSNKRQAISSMPGVYRYTINRLSQIIDRAIKKKIPMVALFPKTQNAHKDELGTESLNEKNLVCRGIQEIKKRYKNQIGIMCDVALDPYTTHGHDGLLKSNTILNDETIEVLINQSLLQADMGCDVIAPSDMMDGRIGRIRKALDKNKFHNVQILSYAAKYASSFYGPFRDAVGSKGSLKGNKKTYQMDYRNSNEALREVALDIKEGADMVMVKPGMPYLDVIKSIKDKFKLPVLAYQVSGEYSLIETAIAKKLINKDAVYESLVAFKRAGANAIVTYYADRLDKILS
jgi:porphobilinogen synthase